MSETIDLTEGVTATVPVQLKFETVAESEIFASFNAAGMTLTLILKDKNGAAVDVSGKVAWTVEATSEAAFSPTASDLVASKSPYTAHWQVTAGGKISFFPNGKPDVWKIHAA